MSQIPLGFQIAAECLKILGERQQGLTDRAVTPPDAGFDALDSRLEAGQFRAVIRTGSARPHRRKRRGLAGIEDLFRFLAQVFGDRVGRDDWGDFDSRVERNTDRVLEVFGDTGVRATFFTLGWVAERHPALIRRIVDAGHELASHGFEHIRVFEQTPEEFRIDVRRTKALLEETGGVAVRGYRAATFSIGEKNTWAFDVLAEEGYAYSSSVYPIRHDLYGMPSAPRFRFRPNGANDLVEYPITTVRLFGRTLPCGGGGYFRLFPYGLSRWAMSRVNRTDGQPCIFYFHPWEVDPEQPRFEGLPFKSRFRHYVNLDVMEHRLRRLAGDFAWDRVDRVFLAPDA